MVADWPQEDPSTRRRWVRYQPDIRVLLVSSQQRLQRRNRMGKLAGDWNLIFFYSFLFPFLQNLSNLSTMLVSSHKDWILDAILIQLPLPSQLAITRNLSSARTLTNSWTTSQPQIQAWDFKSFIALHIINPSSLNSSSVSWSLSNKSSTFDHLACVIYSLRFSHNFFISRD